MLSGWYIDSFLIRNSTTSPRHRLVVILETHHTNDNGKIADELVKFGLTEGSSIIYAFDHHKNGLTKSLKNST